MYRSAPARGARSSRPSSRGTRIRSAATVEFRATATSEQLIFQSQVGGRRHLGGRQRLGRGRSTRPPTPSTSTRADSPQLLYVDASGRLTPSTCTVDPAGYVGNLTSVTCPNSTQCIQFDPSIPNGTQAPIHYASVSSESSGSVYATKNTAAIMPVFESHLEPYYETVTATKPSTSGSDTLTILDTASTQSVDASIQSYQIPVDELYSGGTFRRRRAGAEHRSHPGERNGDGNRRVLLRRRAGHRPAHRCCRSPSSAASRCSIRSPARSSTGRTASSPSRPARSSTTPRCDPVVEQRGANVEALGGEQVVDANGNNVYTGSRRSPSRPARAASRSLAIRSTTSSAPTASRTRSAIRRTWRPCR